jgi:hypothetical protein
MVAAPPNGEEFNLSQQLIVINLKFDLFIKSKQWQDIQALKQK